MYLNDSYLRLHSARSGQSGSIVGNWNKVKSSFLSESGGKKQYYAKPKSNQALKEYLKPVEEKKIKNGFAFDPVLVMNESKEIIVQPWHIIRNVPIESWNHPE